MRFRLTILSMILLFDPAFADSTSHLRDLGQPAGIRQAGTAESSAARVYIVQLRTPSAAEFHAKASASVIGKPAFTAQGGVSVFDKNNAAVLSHVQRLESEQATTIAKAGQNILPIYSYRYSLNGFAARLTEAQASKFGSMPEVLHIWEDEVRPLATDHSATFLGLFDADGGLRGAAGLDGDGIVIGVIDSGITPEHPAVQDTREADRPRACVSAWAENSILGQWLCRRFDQLADVQLFDAPENWNGICQTGPQFTEQNCNNKMIGARYFVEGATATGPIDPGEIFSARDVDGHGTHTATTAAGNRVRASIYGTLLGRVEGIAPKARIAVYKACWLRPGATRSACNTSDLANAIDMAVADGVHLINYSVGNSEFTVTGPDDVALMAAAKAGVLTVVAAGNDGPNFQTIGSPAGNPAVITVAASTRDGQHSVEAMEVTTPAPVAGKYAVREASFSRPLSEVDPLEGQLILVDDDDDSLPDGSTGNAIDACQPLVNGSELSGKIALIQRGGCDFDVKVQHADEAGAIAAIVINLSGDPIVMNGVAGTSDIPALMMAAADGDLLLDELNQDQVVEVSLNKGLLLSVADTGNVMANFSSRGPGPLQDVLKPDVTAPGVNILAGNSPDVVNTVSGELFAFQSGTSMSAPHVTGVAALLKQAHPEWSPAVLKSALMTSARQDITMPDETTIIPFDFGSGHIVPNSASDPGLVYEITDEEYDAFSCGVESPGVDQSRCNELETAGLSFASADLNQPSISVSRLTRQHTVTRRVTNVSENSESYTVEVDQPAGVTVQVSPASLTLAPGQSASYDVTMSFVSGPNDIFRFGSLTWVSNEHRVRSVIAVQPLSIDAPVEVFSSGITGSLSFPVDFGYTGTYLPQVHGLRAADPGLDLQNVAVGNDSTKTFSFRNSNGVSMHLFGVPADEAFLRFELRDELTDGDDDLDMYLYYCPQQLECLDAGNFVLPENFFKIGQSGEETSNEQLSVFIPGAGVYAVLVHGFETDNTSGGPGAVYSLLAWEFGLNDDAGNMTVTGPPSATPGTGGTVTVDWLGLAANSLYLGAISHNSPAGLIALTLVNISN